MTIKRIQVKETQQYWRDFDGSLESIIASLQKKLDDGFLWCGIYHKNGQIDHFNITAKKNKLSTLWMPNCG